MQTGWRPFGHTYEVSSAGSMRNSSTMRAVLVEKPRAGDPYCYVRVMLKNQQGESKQKRLALRNVVAHCWLPASAGFRLRDNGTPSSARRVYHADRNPDNCAAANLVVLEEETARQRGLALTHRGHRPQLPPPPPPQPPVQATPPELMLASLAAPSSCTMLWPAAFDATGSLLP